MERSFVSVCYYPTTVMFVDDDAKYLHKLELLIDTQKASCKLFSNAKEALEWLKKHEPSPFTKRCIERPEESAFDHRNIDIDVRKIWHEMHNLKRFEEISVLVVDYAMPGLSGLEFAKQCRQFKKSPFKILMLTGEADEALAVQAFNDKVIDKFLRKNTPNFEAALNAAINELQEQYFYDLSQLVIDSLTKDPEHPMINWLDEPVFFKLFDEIFKKHHLTEYYLTDAFGSYMFLDFEGKPSWLVVKSEDEMYAAHETADMADDPVPEEILQAMKNRELVLYLHERGGLSDDIDELKRSLHPATKLTGNKSTYYYSYIDNPKAYKIDLDKVLSYKAYREQLFSK